MTIRININVDESVRHDFKMACWRKKKTMTDELKRFIARAIKKDREVHNV